MRHAPVYKASNEANSRSTHRGKRDWERWANEVNPCIKAKKRWEFHKRSWSYRDRERKRWAYPYNKASNSKQ